MSPASPTVRSSFVQRVLRTARLNADAFEEVEADRSALGQATLVVLAASAASASVVAVRAALGRPFPQDALSGGALATVLALEPVVIWLIGAAFAYMIGATFLRGPETETDYAEVLRTTGFAFAPALLFPLAALVPDPGGIALAMLGRLWILAACTVAVRQALDFTTARAVGTYGAAALLMWLLLWGLAVVPLPV
jgi:hypothetical protein